MSDFIPPAVRALMASHWRDKPPGHTHDIATRGGGRRQRDPSYYFVREHVTAESVNEFTPLSYEEMVALHEQGALGEASHHVQGAGQDEGCVIANEFATLSLQEFLSDVTRAWRAHRQRLEELTGPVPEGLTRTDGSVSKRPG